MELIFSDNINTYKFDIPLGNTKKIDVFIMLL